MFLYSCYVHLIRDGLFFGLLFYRFQFTFFDVLFGLFVLLRKVIGYEESKFQGLLLIEAGVTEGSIVCREIVLGEPLASSQTLGDGVAREFEMDTAQVAALFFMDAQGLLQLVVNVVEAAGLDASLGRQGVSVHGVALPDDAAAVLGVLDGADVLGQQVSDLGGAVAGDQCDFARLALRVQGAQQVEQVGHGRGGADFDANGVGDAAEELDVRVVQLASAVADPEEMRRRVVVFAAFLDHVGASRSTTTRVVEGWG